LSSISPVSTSKFSSWWYWAIKDVPKEMKKELSSLITLVAWECKSERHNSTADNHK